MTIRRVVPNISTGRLDESRKFYTEFLGFDVAMDMGWIVTFVSPSNPTAQVSLLRGDTPVPPSQNLSLFIEVADVDGLHAKAVAQGVPVIYPLTTKLWGVRRFHVTDPNGVVINVMSHVKNAGPAASNHH
jgi:predicted enzyme related to lactoylglutathione lyase